MKKRDLVLWISHLQDSIVLINAQHEFSYKVHGLQLAL